MLAPPAAIEAILFASGEPFEKKRLAALLSLSEDELKAALGELNNSLKGRGISLVETETDVELRTSPEAAQLVKELRESELARDLGRAGLETLAIVAYQTNTTRSEIDWVRGVNSSTSLRTLLLRGLIEGREDPHDRRRTRYTLTTEALAHLSLARAEEFPRFEELSSGIRGALEEETATAGAITENIPA